MLKTHVRPSRDLRNHYAEVVQLVKAHDQVVITNHGKGEAVLIGMEEYARYEEFLHRHYVETQLEKAQQQANDPATVWATHEEVWGGNGDTP